MKMIDLSVRRQTRYNCKTPLYRIRNNCCKYNKEFGHSKMMLTQRDIMWLLNEQQLNIDQDICIVPIQPSCPITRQNAVCVDTKQKTFLIALWRLSKDEACYTNNVKSIFHKLKSN